MNNDTYNVTFNDAENKLTISDLGNVDMSAWEGYDLSLDQLVVYDLDQYVEYNTTMEVPTGSGTVDIVTVTSDEVTYDNK